jgi:hypothetical protein
MILSNSSLAVSKILQARTYLQSSNLQAEIVSEKIPSLEQVNNLLEIELIFRC